MSTNDKDADRVVAVRCRHRRVEVQEVAHVVVVSEVSGGEVGRMFSVDPWPTGRGTVLCCECDREQPYTLNRRRLPKWALRAVDAFEHRLDAEPPHPE